MCKKRVLLGMSGGTDSSVCAMMLKEQGYEVVGLTFRLWSSIDSNDMSNEPDYIIDARNLAQRLQIEHSVVDLKDYFYSNIISYFKEEYMAGRTPNPCAKCNVVLKWRFLEQEADRQKCDFISTGHYANIIEYNHKFYITYGDDPEKEQSFFLWGLSQNILKRALLPLGKLTKEQVKDYARQKGFEKVAGKKESIGVCFINGGDYKPFLEDLLKQEGSLPGKGNFIDQLGKVVGVHNGYPFYTVGQRRGLGLVPEEPWYVTNINPTTNAITLGKRHDLYQADMEVIDYYFHDLEDIQDEVTVRIRYRKQKAMGKIEILSNEKLLVRFAEPEWSIAPGQTAAFYVGDRLIGGGFIQC